ncbi:MAG: hypothetical protein JXR30_01895 [Alphaproteobacteria bacterium]|nr:hypothetical protein [Alphaproteobacteria bacterium]
MEEHCLSPLRKIQNLSPEQKAVFFQIIKAADKVCEKDKNLFAQHFDPNGTPKIVDPSKEHMTRHEYIQIGQDYLNKKHLNAILGFIGGSIIRQKNNNISGLYLSDLDMITVYHPEDLPTPYKENIAYKKCPIDAYCENTESLIARLDKETQEGHCETMMIIADSVLYPQNNSFGKKIRDEVQAKLAEGPLKITEAKEEELRLAITNSLADLQGSNRKIFQYIALANLMESLADFYLRVNRKWSGEGKKIFQFLEMNYPELAVKYETVFKKAFENGEETEVLALADQMLSPHKGFLWSGYQKEL